ncbi:uncharacterized protein EV420DRAFT_1576538 [Desarmillaria tabescens]|uniref:Uncharacterized protein n=1 Tax=Armillaria tabescens TaxID=1929756 RepID=A0AA39JJ15_ARMTA|nr:uncharacterized protein EV420DRAFT_1576538 [Desarmillaria tabescens]KAK0443369.1 hypothetical protein EV420DRAFT_1576538 [Desarmillaria tabescens]
MPPDEQVQILLNFKRPYSPCALDSGQRTTLFPIILKSIGCFCRPFSQTNTTMFIARSPRVQLLSKCWYFAGTSLYLLEILHYFRIFPLTTLATQERVISTMLSTGAITGLAIVTVLVILLFFLNLTTKRPGARKMSWMGILDGLSPQSIFFVCLIINDAMYQRVPGTSVLEGGSARIGVLIVQLWGYMTYIGIPLVGSVGFTTYSIAREQARDVERASMKT